MRSILLMCTRTRNHYSMEQRLELMTATCPTISLLRALNVLPVDDVEASRLFRPLIYIYVVYSVRM